MSWEYVLIPAVALSASLLTFFSGFGLGTLLLPAFAVFYPTPLAVAATAIVHLANNLVKFSLLARFARRDVLIRFAIPAVVAGIAGAWLLTRLGDMPPIATYSLAGKTFAVEPVSVVVGILMMTFALIEFLPKLEQMQLSPRWLPLGGLLSGFFGGLSGLQGALRAAFLARTGMDGKEFIGTSVSIAVAVDLVRLSIYLTTQAHDFKSLLQHGDGSLLIAAILAALVGTMIGKSQLKKITIGAIRTLVGILLFVLGALLATGII